MTITEKQKEIAEEFAFFDDWMDKYEHIIELGKDLPMLTEEEKTDDLLIRGCQSRVWLKASLDGEKVVFRGDSDAIITKGIISLLIRALSGHPAKEIVNADMDFIKEIGLYEHLSPTRSNGLQSMIKQMKSYALIYNEASNG